MRKIRLPDHQGRYLYHLHILRHLVLATGGLAVLEVDSDLRHIALSRYWAQQLHPQIDYLLLGTVLQPIQYYHQIFRQAAPGLNPRSASKFCSLVTSGPEESFFMV